MGTKIYLNGSIVDPDEARISVFDRGFLYGDSVFETLRVYSGVPFAFTAHVARLLASAGRIGLELPWDEPHLEKALRQTQEASALADAYVRMIATRGSGPVNLDPTTAHDPVLIVIVTELPALPALLYESGRTAQLVPASAAAQTAVDPQAKTGNYLNSVLALRAARAAGADEAIRLAPDGRVTEASAANVFAWLDGAWCTPPLEVGILSGITRQTILRLCPEARQQVLWPDDLRHAEEIFLCASVREVVPIVRLDGASVGQGVVGPRTREMLRRYRGEVSHCVAIAQAAAANPSAE